MHLNCSVQRDIWDGHSFHRVFLLSFFFCTPWLWGVMCFGAKRNTTAFINWEHVLCVKYTMCILNSWYNYGVDSTLHRSPYSLYIEFEEFVGGTVMLVLYALSMHAPIFIWTCASTLNTVWIFDLCEQMEYFYCQVLSNSSHFWKDEFANFLDEIKELDVGPHVRSFALLLRYHNKLKPDPVLRHADSITGCRSSFPFLRPVCIHRDFMKCLLASLDFLLSLSSAACIPTYPD